MSTFFNHDPSRVDAGEIQRLHQQIDQLERCLAISSSRQRQLMATMSEIAWIANADGSMIDFNPRWYEYSGLGVTESAAWGFLKVVHPEDRDRILCAIEQTSINQQSYSFNLRLLKSTGTYQWFKAQATPVVADGVVEWVGTYTAIASDEYSAEGAEEAEGAEGAGGVEIAQQRYRDLVDGLVDAIVWECDAVTLKFSFVSKSAENILGYPVSNWLTKPNFWAGLIHPEDREWVTNYCSEETISGRDHEFEYRCIAADGRVVWLRDRAYIVRDSEGEVQKLRGLMVDITQQKQAEAEKEQALAAMKTRAEELAKMAAVLAKTNAVLEKRNQELDQFAYVTSHDLKAPLRAIANLSDWIEEDIEDVLTDETRHQMQLLRGRVHRMEGLINALLEYSRIGRSQNQIQRVDVNDLIAEIIDAIAPPPQFKIDVSPGMPTIVTELLPLQQVFTNLITNAIKHHNREDGTVKISVQDQGKFYKFIVADDGLGIAPEFQEKIFVIFQTLQARDKVENTGVGLALVKKIIEHQGGSISVESAEGQGATFSFTWHK